MITDKKQLPDGNIFDICALLVNKTVSTCSRLYFFPENFMSKYTGPSKLEISPTHFLQ